MKKILIFIWLIWSVETIAGTNGTVSGHIKSIQIKETGYLLIQFEQNHANQAGCLKADTIAVAPSSVVFEKIFSIALTAYATKKRFTSYATLPCYEKYGSSYPVGINAAIIE